MTPSTDRLQTDKHHLGKRNSQRGLTLFELLIVLAILALLASVIAPRVIGYLGRAKSDVAKSQLANISTALELLYFDIGRYPSEEEGLAALVEQPESMDRWQGPYLKEAEGLKDPWARAYTFQINETGDGFVVGTFGRDGEPGGDGEDADIAKR